MSRSSHALVFGAAAALLFSPTLAAQTEAVPHKEAKRHVGQIITVEGPVAKVRSTADGTMQLEIGRPYPGSSLVVLIPESAVSSFGEVRELEGKLIRVNGRIRASSLERGSEGTVPMNRASTEPDLVKAPSLVLTEPGKLQVLGPAK